MEIYKSKKITHFFSLIFITFYRILQNIFKLKMVVIILLILTLQANVQSYPYYTKANFTFAWPEDTFISLANLNLTQNNVPPYQIVEDRGPGQVNIWYDYTGFGSQTSSVIWKNTEPYYIRVDNDDDIFFQIEASVQLPSNTAKFTFRLYIQFQDIVSSTFVNIICISINRYFAGSGNYLIAGDDYRLNSGTVKYLIINNAQNPFSKTIRLKQINDILLKTNQINKFFYLKQVSVVFSTFDAGNVSANVQKKLPYKRSYLKPVSRHLPNYHLASLILYPENRSSLDYSNLTMPSNVKSAEQTLSDFLFITTEFRLNAYHSVTIGQLNGTLVSKNYNNLFPISCSKDISIIVDFSFREQNYNSSTLKAACLVIIFAEDQSSTHPSAQVFVCPWWSTNLPIKGTFVKLYQDGDKSYSLFTNTSSSGASAQWTTYSFIQKVNQLQTRGLNLFWFAQMVILQNPLIAKKKIVAIQAGFRFYVGQGMFQFKEINFEVNETNPLSIFGSTLYTVLIWLISTPNLSILVKMVSMLRFFDYFSYYTYHKPRYDYAATTYFKLAWNLTNARWNIPQLNSIYQTFNISYRQLLPPSPTQHTPTTYLTLGENTAFLHQTEDFWLRVLPLTIIIFFIGYFIFQLLTKFRWALKFIGLLKNFSLLSLIWVSIFGESLYYFSFRCFSQIYELKGTLSLLPNIIVAYIMLFFILFYAISSYFVLPEFSPCLRKLLQGYNVCFNTIVFMITLNISRIITGFIHSLQYEDEIIQTSCLLVIQIITLILILQNRRMYLRKTILTSQVINSIIHIITHIALLCQTILKKYGYDLSVQQRVSLASISDTLLGTLLLICGVEVIFDNLIGYGQQSLINVELQTNIKNLHPSNIKPKDQKRQIIYLRYIPARKQRGQQLGVSKFRTKNTNNDELENSSNILKFEHKKINIKISRSSQFGQFQNKPFQLTDATAPKKPVLQKPFSLRKSNQQSIANRISILKGRINFLQPKN